MLELENLTDETQYFCFVSEDEYGNRMNFYDYEKIPTYVAPEPPVQPEDTFNIASLRVEKDTLFPLEKYTIFISPLMRKVLQGRLNCQILPSGEWAYLLNGDKGFFTKKC